jgi:hypothetical protein
MLNKGIFINLLFSAFFISFISSCVYKTDEVYERNVNQDVTPPKITAVSLNPLYDTIFLYSTGKVVFSFTSDNQKIRGVRLVVNKREYSMVNSGTGTFTLDADSFSDGTYKMSIEVFTGSGTGSIADILGYEGYMGTYTWTLVVNGRYYSHITPSVNNGLLNLSWKSYRGYDFKEYIITRASDKGEVEVGRSFTNHFIDSSYVGEGTIYYINIDRKGDEHLGWASLSLSQNLKTELSTDASEPGRLFIKWGKNDYFNAVDSYQLFIENRFSSDYTKVKSTPDPEDNSFEVKGFKFNDHFDIRMRIVPKKNVQYYESAYYMFENYLYKVTVGYSYDPYNSNNEYIFQVSKDEFIYVSGCYRMIRYSVSGKTEVETFRHDPIGCSACSFTNLSYSASGKYAAAYVDCDYKVMLIKTSDMADNQIRDLNTYYGQNYFPPILVSDAGIVLVDKINSGFYLYDFNTSSSLAYYQGNTVWCKGIRISADSKYIYLRDDSLKLVRFENSKFTRIWSQPNFESEPIYFEFDPVNPGQLFLWDGARFYAKRCSDFTTLYDFALTDKSIQNIDFYNGEILTYNTGHLLIRSLADGSLLKDVPISFDADSYTGKCILVDNAICCISGVIDYFE